MTMRSKKSYMGGVNLPLIILCGILTILLATGLAYTIAYFTATSRQNGDLEFADLEVNLLSSGATLTDAKFQSEYLYNLTPGDMVDFATITVKNTGDVDVYCLIKLDLEITKVDSNKINISKWYNLDAKVVNSTNLPANTVPASHIAMNSSDTIDLTYTFNGNSYDNSYKGATVKVTLGAYAVQYANLPTDDTYTTRDLYATYLIIDTYGGDNIQLMSLTLNIDGTPTTYQAEAGSTLLEVASANNMADIEYNTCGFYTDSALTYGVDAESYMITEDVTLYSKTATPSSLTFRVNSTTSTTATTMATTMASTYINNATFSVSAASASISGNVVIPKRYRSGNNDGYVTLIPSPILDLDTFTTDMTLGFPQTTNAYTLQLPNTITKIDIGAFMYGSITNIYIPNGLRVMDAAFPASALTSIHIPETVESVASVYLNEAVAEVIGGEVVGTFTYCQNLSSVTFAKNSRITTLWPCMFSNCIFTTITIPKSVTTFESYDDYIGPLGWCYSLETVIFEEGSQLKTIGLRAFENCESLKEITIPSTVTSIGQYAFTFCTALTSVDFEEEGTQLTELSFGTFYYCTSLKDFIIPSSVKTIGQLVFFKCTALESIYLPSTVDTFSPFMFNNSDEPVSTIIYTDVVDAAACADKWGGSFINGVYDTSLEEYKAIINA